MKIIKKAEELPGKYFPKNSPPLKVRGVMNCNYMLKTPKDLASLNGQSIYIQKKDTKGENPEDYELVKVELEVVQEIKPATIEDNNDGDVIEQKRRKLLEKKDFDFHYLQEKTINNYYKSDVNSPVNQVIDRLQLEIENQIRVDTEVDVASKIGTILNQDSIIRIISEINFDGLDHYQQFPIVHGKKLRNGEVGLGLELAGSSFDELVKFDNAISFLQSRQKLDVEQISRDRQNLGTKIIGNIFNALDQETYSHVIVSGQFAIEKVETNYHLALLHPVSKRIQNLELKLIAIVPDDCIEVDWKHLYTPGETIEANVFGKIARRSANESVGKWEIFLNPSAIYS